MTGPLNSVVTNRNRDCLACRLVSGVGLIGAGFYVSHHSKKFNRATGKTIMFSIASVETMEFPHLGEHCSEKTCNRLDFLPLRCDACDSIFCTDHISYLGHSCPSAYKKDVQVPVCPMCNVPIPFKRGEPPDLAVGSHIDNDCQADSSKDRRKIFTNKCSTKGCKIKEIVRVDCSDCGRNFCLKHRHPTDHNCVGRAEATRLKRLEALNKQSLRSGNSSRTNNAGDSLRSFRNLQGGMSEDEALARALQASLQDEDSGGRQLQAVPSNNSGHRCRLS